MSHEVPHQCLALSRDVAQLRSKGNRIPDGLRPLAGHSFLLLLTGLTRAVSGTSKETNTSADAMRERWQARPIDLAEIDPLTDGQLLERLASRPLFSSAAGSEAAFPDCIARVLAFTEEFHIRHDRLVGMLRAPVRNVCLVIGNADHQTRSARASITGSPRRTGGPVEQILQIRHGHLLQLLRRTRFPLQSAA